MPQTCFSNCSLATVFPPASAEALQQMHFLIGQRHLVFARIAVHEQLMPGQKPVAAPQRHLIGLLLLPERYNLVKQCLQQFGGNPRTSNTAHGQSSATGSLATSNDTDAMNGLAFS